MTALLSFLYGVAAYGASVVALLYLMGFSGNYLVPTTVDLGRAAPWPLAVLIDVLLISLFAVQHSVMARQSFKRWCRRRLAPAVERSTYVLATSLVLAVLFWQWRPIATPIIWRLDQPAASAVLTALFWTGWALVLFSTFLLNHFELFGLQQVFARLTGRDLPAMRFRTPLLYRYVRHPIYLGIVLTLWSVPVMTAGHLLYAAGFSVYILIGIALEERDLIAQFGERYRRYREQVGMLIPRRTRP